MANRPSAQIYGVNDRPPARIIAVLTAQHMLLALMLLVYPVVLAGRIGLDAEATRHLVIMSLFGVAFATVLQTTRFGMGYLAVALPNPNLVPVFSATIKYSSLGGLIGTMIACGIIQLGIARILPRLRAFFPPEVCGVPVLMLGMSLAGDALARFVGYGSIEQPFDGASLVAGLATLLPIVGLTIWGGRHLRIYALLAGCACGYSLAIFLGLLGPEARDQIAAIPLFEVPQFAPPDLHLDINALLPLTIAMLVSLMSAVGSIIALDKVADPDWKRTNMNLVARGVQANALAGILSGLFGGINTAFSSANIGLQFASGVTSRVIGVVTGALLAVIAFLPKVAAFLVFMPGPVKGAIMLFAAGCLITAGFELIAARMLNDRRSILVGLSIILGLSVNALPGIYQGLPAWVVTVFQSEVTVAALAALILNGLFRIGLAREARLTIAPSAEKLDEVWRFFEAWGGNWGARREVVERARHVVMEAIEALVTLGAVKGGIRIGLDYDEFNFNVSLRYEGVGLRLSTEAFDPAGLLALDTNDGEFARRFDDIAIELVRRRTDRITQTIKGETVRIALHFDH